MGSESEASSSLFLFLKRICFGRRVFIAALFYSCSELGALFTLLGPGISLLQLLSVQVTGSRVQASVAVTPRLQSTGSTVVHGLSCSVACGIFLDQGSNPCLLPWRADSSPLSHQRNPSNSMIFYNIRKHIFFGCVSGERAVTDCRKVQDQTFLSLPGKPFYSLS